MSLPARERHAVMNAQYLDPLPIWLLFVLFCIITLLCYELAFRFGR